MPWLTNNKCPPILYKRNFPSKLTLGSFSHLGYFNKYLVSTFPQTDKNPHFTYRLLCRANSAFLHSLKFQMYRNPPSAHRYKHLRVFCRRNGRIYINIQKSVTAFMVDTLRGVNYCLFARPSATQLITQVILPVRRLKIRELSCPGGASYLAGTCRELSSAGVIVADIALAWPEWLILVQRQDTVSYRWPCRVMIRGTRDNPPPLVRHPCVSCERPSYLYHRLMVSRMPGNFVAREDTFHEPSHRRQTYRKTRGILIEIGPLTTRTRSCPHFEPAIT